MQIISTILLLGSLQSILLALVFLFRNNELSFKIFGVVLATISCALFLASLEIQIDFKEYPFLIKTNMPLSLVFIPFLYLYLRLLIGSDNKLRRKHLMYFVPFLIIFAYNIPFYFGDITDKIDYYNRVDISGNLNLSEKLEDIFVNGITLLFSVLIFLEAIGYKKRALKVFSDLNKAKINWIFFLTLSMVVLSGFAFSIAIFQIISSSEVSGGLNFITALGATIIVIFIAVKALISPEIFSKISAETGVLIRSEETKEDAKKEVKEMPIYQDIVDKVNSLLNLGKIYRDPDLTLSKLSSEAKIPAYLISKMIGSKLNTNFYTLINSYRLKEVKQKLIEEPVKGIMEVAYESGFNSKTTFYDVFKKDTGMTPSAFKKNQSKSVI